MALAEPSARVRGSAANICLSREKASIPNMGFAVTRGQEASSRSRKATAGFNSSAALGIGIRRLFVALGLRVGTGLVPDVCHQALDFSFDGGVGREQRQARR